MMFASAEAERNIKTAAETNAVWGEWGLNGLTFSMLIEHVDIF